MSEVVLVLIGAALGFLGSTCGAVIAERLRIRGERRRYLHEILLPELRASLCFWTEPDELNWTADHEENHELPHLDSLRIASAYLSRRERGYATVLLRANRNRKKAGFERLFDGAPGWESRPDEDFAVFSESGLEVLEVLDKFEGLVERKLTGAPWL